MLTNRSAPHARVVPVLTVADVRAAVAWYARVLGFVEHVRIVVAEVRPGRRDWEYGARQATFDEPFGHQFNACIEVRLA